MKTSDYITDGMVHLKSENNLSVRWIFCYQRYKQDISKTAVTAVTLTAGDHIIIICSWVNNKYEANSFWRCFVMEDRVLMG